MAERSSGRFPTGYAKVGSLARMLHDELFAHAGYVSDPVKVDACWRALRNVIRPDDVVIDMGCGTGLLVLLALEAGLLG